MYRRDFLLGSGALAISAVTQARPTLAQAGAPPAIIDVHCHIFNADDLPIIGFVERVVVPSREEFKNYETRYGHVIRFLVRYLAGWMRSNAPSAADEIALLDRIKAGTAQPRTLQQIAQADINNLEKLIDELRGLRIAERNFSFRERFVSGYLPGIVVGMMHREAYPRRFKDTGIGNSDGAFEPDQWVHSNELAEKLYHEGKGALSHYLRWASTFTHYRHELADEISRIHGGRAKLATPALIDYSHWLNDGDDMRLPRQVEVMGRIARRGGAMRVHGFAPFDPLREAIHRKTSATGESPLDLVKRAVKSEGFVGVKLYPPMGFLPYDNAKKLFAGDYPQHLRPIFDKRMNFALDAVLEDLYSWSASENVPLLAHAADSNGAGEKYSKRADPANWSAVTAKYPGIRISLAHFGDFEAGFDRPGNRNPKLSDTWEWRMATLIKANPQSPIYIDLSYLSVAFLDNTNGRWREVVRMLKGLREFDVLASRMLFGTDWIMLGKEESFPQYDSAGHFADRVAALLKAADFSDAQIEQVMHVNAGNFLGLTLPSNVPGNRQRMTAFYQTHQLNAGWLNGFPISQT
jgi:predicted TIM-barrel fold metal-dependent hydrolase